MDALTVVFGVWALAAVVTTLVVALMLAAETTATAASGVSQTGGVDDCGGATTGAAAAAPAEPDVVTDDAAAARFEAEQQAIEDEQRAKLPEMLRNQSGMLPDNYMGYGPWTVLEPEPRIKESKVEAPLKAKLLAHLAKCFEPETLLGKRVPFDPTDVAEVMDNVMLYLKSEPMLIEDVPYGITVVGDLHGQLYDLYRIFKHFEKDGKPGWERMKFLFLGNYVDRGRQGLEIVMALFSLKALYPDRIFLLRGKHEFVKINLKNGFLEELNDRYSTKTAKEMFLYVNATFTVLSIAAIVQDKYLCVHSGLSAHGFNRNNLRGIRKPCYHYNEDYLITDIMWAEPAGGLRGSAFNGTRGSSIYFGLDDLVFSLCTIGAEILVRAHSGLLKGCSSMGNGMCISLTSATGTLGGDNDGSIMLIDDEGYYKVILMKMNKNRVNWERKLKILDDGGILEEEKPPTKMVDPVGPPKNQKSIKRNNSIKKKK